MPQAEQRALAAKYEALYAPMYSKRAAVVTGTQEVAQPAEDTSDAPAGVPEFWLIALRNHEAFESQVTDKDAAVLAHLEDISSVPVSGEDEDGDAVYGFELRFSFSANPFFSEKVLVKRYEFSDEEESYLVKSSGTEISWAAGKNPTVKVMKKKGKPGKGGAPAKVLTKLEPTQSFFNFFSPPEVPDEADDLEEEEAEALQDAMEGDHELGMIIKDDIIPNAVSWFTGAAIEGGEEDEDEGEDDDDEDDEARRVSRRSRNEADACACDSFRMRKTRRRRRRRPRARASLRASPRVRQGLQVRRGVSRNASSNERWRWGRATRAGRHFACGVLCGSRHLGCTSWLVLCGRRISSRNSRAMRPRASLLGAVRRA